MKEIERIKLKEIVKSQERLSTMDNIIGTASHGRYLVDATETNMLSIELFVNQISPYLIKLVNLYESMGTKIKVAMVFESEAFATGSERAEYLRDRGISIEAFNDFSAAEKWLQN